MFKQAIIFSAITFAAACALDSTGSTSGAIIDMPCAADTDCPSGFECEIEVEHGITTTFCKSHDADGACPPGYETEVEHGQTYCKPHGGDDGGSGSGSGGGTACTTDSDCAAGLECEVEVEHGQTTSTCKPHGGN